MKLSAILVLLAACVSVARSQTLTGRVLDEKQRPADFATILLLRSKDSTLLKSALTDSKGKYKFSSVPAGMYLVSASLLGYQKNYTAVTMSGQEVQVPDIRLVAGSSTLREVSVTAQRPFLEQRADKLVVNVEGSATAAGSTALEILQKVPGLIVANDKITMVGKGSPNIYIDGRPSQYTDVTQLLRDISAGNIARIEVISNPGSKYDATGGSVINIILKRNANLGTNGSLSLSSGIGLYERGSFGTDRNYYRLSPSVSLNHRQGKFSTFISHSYFHQNTYDYSEFRRIIGDTTYLQRNYNPNSGNSHNFRLGADFYADKKNTFGFLIRGFVRNGDRIGNNTTDAFRTTEPSAAVGFTSLNNATRERKNFSGNLNWKHSFDTLGTDLNIDLDYSRFSLQNHGQISTHFTDGAEIVEQSVDNPVKFTVLKIDYSRPLGKEGKLEAGAKSSLASIDNLPTYLRNSIFNADRSADFWYKENINAFYGSVQQKLGKWNLQAGLRTEQTAASGKDSLQKVLDRNYWQLFPSVFVTREISSKLAAVLQYTRRVNRPSYQQQNPFIEYLDALTYTQGNPKLRPETADQYKVALTYQKQPFFSLNYNRKRDVIINNAPKQEGNKTFTTPENLASFENFAAELNFPLNIGKKISGYGGNQLIYNHYKASYLNDVYNNGKWNWLAYWQVAYKPVADWSAEVSGYYMTRFLDEFLILDNLGSLNFAIQKSFWNKKGKLSLNFNDILLSDRVRARIGYNQINVDFKQVYDSRNARLTFSYSFGNQQLKAPRSRKTASEDESNRVKAGN